MVSKDDLRDAVAILRRDGLVAFPTETVYGLGCDAQSRVALRRLYDVKGRPAGHPVIVHLPAVASLPEWTSKVPPTAATLADACWPGPLTLVVPRSDRVPDEVTGGRDGVALRVPNQPIALALLDAFGDGLAAPSANRFGRVSPTTAADVRADLGDDVDLVLDGGPCAVGVESTIVDCTGDVPVILRLGACTREHLEELLRAPVALQVDGERAAPGTLPSHYAPDASVVIVERDDIDAVATKTITSGARVGLLALDPPDDLPDDLVVLEAPIDVDDYARVLYTRLREADRRGLDIVLAVPPPELGVGAAVKDRLRRAACGGAS